MPITIVRCSKPGCQGVAETKVAAPWKGGAFAELKTYGYACPDHDEWVVEYAETRPKPRSYSPEESVGPLQTYPLPSPD